MDSKGKSAQKVMFGKLSSETVTMAPLGSKTSRLMSVRDGASRAPRDLPYHTQVSGAEFRDFNGGLKSKKHGASVCVLSEATIYYFERPQMQVHWTPLSLRMEEEQRAWVFFFSQEQKVSNMEANTPTHAHTHFIVKSPLRMILLFSIFSN